ncbi:hypothetical protein HanIR_Chr02g0062361 [Helianthus annuus]|nr:hypothetical protein HanIR_Chr02g0062361 [Helianthus annuus]
MFVGRASRVTLLIHFIQEICVCFFFLILFLIWGFGFYTLCILEFREWIFSILSYRKVVVLKLP